MKVVKPGTPLPAGIREKLESLPPSTGRGGSVRPGSIPPERPGTKSGSLRPGTKSGTLRPGSIPPERPGTRSGPMTMPTPARPSVKPSAPPPVRSASLDEVERALSVLGGRHPDAERVEREVRAEREWRQREVEAEAKRARRNRRIRRVLQVVFAVGAVAAGIYGYGVYQARSANESAMDARAQLYTAHGFTPWVAPKWPHGASLETDVDTSVCAVAVGTSVLEGSLTVTRGADTRTTQGSAAFCACPGEHIKVQSTDTNAPMVRLLRIEPRAVGGPVGLAFLDPKAQLVLPSTGASCTPGALETWLNEGHGPSKANVSLDKSPGMSTLAPVGFSVIASTPRTEPLMLVRSGGPERCVLVASTAEEDPLTLRLGGVEPAQLHGTGRVAWCSAVAQIATIEHGGAGDLVAYEVQASQIGGSLGLVEWEARAHAAPTFSGKLDASKNADWPYVAPGDLAWDALLALRASGASDAKITAGANMVQWVADARLSSIALLPPGDVQPADGAPIYGCTPAFGSPRTLCSEAGPTTWQVSGPAGDVGIAQAGMPFWLSALNGDDEAGAQDAAAAMLAFTRRMTALGFAPTTIDHVTELDSGVEVMGRRGEDEIVAVAVGVAPPFVVPYTDAVPWKLASDPRVLPLPPGQVARLVPSAGVLDIPRNKRRTVVYRHKISLAPTTTVTDGAPQK